MAGFDSPTGGWFSLPADIEAEAASAGEHFGYATSATNNGTKSFGASPCCSIRNRIAATGSGLDIGNLFSSSPCGEFAVVSISLSILASAASYLPFVLIIWLSSNFLRANPVVIYVRPGKSNTN